MRRRWSPATSAVEPELQRVAAAWTRSTWMRPGSSRCCRGLRSADCVARCLVATLLTSGQVRARDACACLGFRRSPTPSCATSTVGEAAARLVRRSSANVTRAGVLGWRDAIERVEGCFALPVFAFFREARALLELMSRLCFLARLEPVRSRSRQSPLLARKSH